MKTIEYVGLLDTLGLGKAWRLQNPLRLSVNPYSSGTQLEQLVLRDLLSENIIDQLPMGRDEAMKIPAVSKLRNLLVATICRFPLKALRELADGTDEDVTQSYPFLYRTDSEISPQTRMAWTIDSLLFWGIAIWRITKRGAERDGRRAILEAEWVPNDMWTVTNGHFHINEEEVDREDVIVFNSPFEGLLKVGSRTLKGARDIEEAWVARIRNPIPITELRVTDDTQLDQDEIDEWGDYWTTRHTAGKPSFGITPAGTQLETHGGEDSDAQMFIESRNSIRTDIGSFGNVRASMLDGTAGIDSLTYSTTEGEKNSFYEFDLPFWTDPIEWALSVDRVVARGTRVRFDKYEGYHQPTPTGAPTKD